MGSKLSLFARRATPENVTEEVDVSSAEKVRSWLASSFDTGGDDGRQQGQGQPDPQPGTSTAHQVTMTPSTFKPLFQPLQLLPRPIPGLTPALIGARPPEKLSDFIYPFCHNLSRELLGSNCDEILNGHRVFWISGQPQTGIGQWAKLAFPGYLKVYTASDLEGFVPGIHRGILVTCELEMDRYWPEDQVFRLIFGDSRFRTIPRIVVSSSRPCVVLTTKYKWTREEFREKVINSKTVHMKLYGDKPRIRGKSDADPRRIRLAYESQVKKEMVLRDMGKWTDLPRILTAVAHYQEEREKKPKTVKKGTDEIDGKLEGQEEKNVVKRRKWTATDV